MNEAVHDTVGDDGVANLLVPVLHWHLAGDNGRTALVTVIADLQKIASFLFFHGRHGEIVDDQHIDVGQAPQEPPKLPSRIAKILECTDGPWFTTMEFEAKHHQRRPSSGLRDGSRETAPQE